ncbi:MAG: tRNA (adenosine(37)-N6)-dimethylallyltransferase MiaA [Acidobacteriia bacterium]|nr:tRNA (adenosine(37)-N6)-dimethylallyltransferase MiaA [Terriglobia bacterium]
MELVSHQLEASRPTTRDAARLPLVAVLGPTGSGKSELALHIAGQFDGEIVNCDSLQVYRYFNVGTAKLPPEARRGIPHHLLDIRNPDELFTAGEFARRARATLMEISARGKLPVLAGGTGFYVRALLDGLFPGPQRDQTLRDRLERREKRRPGSLHRILQRLDKITGARIHPHDVPKVMRALEICLLLRQPAAQSFSTGRDALGGYRVLKIGLMPDRDALYERLDQRCAAMFAGGLIEEVRGILELGFAPSAKPFESHGYKQVLQVLQGELTVAQAIFYAQRNTRRYAKRQMTWFRQEKDIEWLEGFGDRAATQMAGLALVRTHLVCP